MIGRRRLPIDTGLGIGIKFEDYPNVPRLVGAVVSSGLATLHECQTVYGLEDLYDLLEVQAVDAHNRRQVEQRRRNADRY